MLSWSDDEILRQNAFAYLRLKRDLGGGVIRYEDVFDFEFRGTRIALMDPQRGIRKPRQLEAALSFRTVFSAKPDERPYDDEPGADGFLRYKWRGTDPNHPENRALRVAQRQQLELIWFNGVAQGLYLPVFPVWLVAEEPEEHQFVVALDRVELEEWTPTADNPLLRRYAETVTQQRIHQPMFRARVLSAYANKCTVCRFKHRALLDAAHIKPDSEGGEPVVTNGLSLCRIHHGAYDENLIGISPDYRIEVRPDVLEETDGPTLQYSIKEMHQQRIELPRQRAARPSRELLAERFERFQTP